MASLDGSLQPGVLPFARVQGLEFRVLGRLGGAFKAFEKY